MRLFFLLFLALAATRLGYAQDNPDPMNVVMLISDDQRWDALGAAGNDVIHTPYLDSLASDGVRFTQAFVTTSICMTSRASILTGQHMARHDITRFGVPLTPEAFSETYAGVLREGGYWSGFVGKYGVGGARQEDFDFLRSYQGRHWMEVDGERIHVTERNARDSIDFLRERPRDKPFLLSVSYFAPHAEDSAEEQYLPQEWSAEFYEDAHVPESPMMDEAYLEALPAFLSQESNEGRVRYHWRFDTPERFQEYMINYFRLITGVDEAVGRIVNELKEQGVYENTLILFMGDNGYFHAERGLADKWYPYEESIRVPLIIHDPRLPADARGITRDEVVLNIDLAPTAVAAAGLAIPEAMQGEDLAQIYLQEEAPEWRDEFLYEHPTISNRERIPTSQAVVRRDLKYTFWPEWDYEQLFDLRSDPTEKINLVDDPGYAGELAEMRTRLETLLEGAR
ncbi:MAG: sulfatase [Opitutales bacterium]